MTVAVTEKEVGVGTLRGLPLPYVDRRRTALCILQACQIQRRRRARGAVTVAVTEKEVGVGTLRERRQHDAKRKNQDEEKRLGYHARQCFVFALRAGCAPRGDCHVPYYSASARNRAEYGQ